MNITETLAKVSARSGLAKGEIIIRTIALLLVIAFLAFVAVLSKEWLFSTLAAAIVSIGFLVGIFRKDQQPLG